ncbi:MAG: D-alanyl-D-alanine carboxypeptidase/D-alanyl-D-alanine-endopeptidase [Firmicutes bacterium]|nr:D-alanyl-D-alanine carboxypeptidase/D-alanyl-D-alanine-endopeptidase [Bacillota bacterium]
MKKIYLKVVFTLFFAVSLVFILLWLCPKIIASPLVSSSPGAAEENNKFSSRIEAAINAPRYKHSNWGIMISDFSSGEVLYQLNSDKMFSPASTTKLFTVAAAMDCLGAGYRFETPVYFKGETAGSVLKGDLILAASGDLTMGGRTDANGGIAYTNADHSEADAFQGKAELTLQYPLAGLNSLARQVADLGIKKLQGDVVIDDRLFNEFQPKDKGADFVLSPIIINDNLIDIEIAPAKQGEDAKVNWRPKSRAYSVKSYVKTVKGPGEIKIKSAGTREIIVTGSIAAGESPLVYTYQVKKPASFARSLFIEALKRAGVEVIAPELAENPVWKLPKNYSGLQRVALLKSPPFSENAKLILKVSHNLHADTLPLLIAVKNGRKTFEEGMALEKPFFASAGVDTDSISLSDGAGGSRSDFITPAAVTQLLRYMSTRPDFSAYYKALPILGVDGTLVSVVDKNSPVRGMVYAKTGTIAAEDLLNGRGMLGAKALAGYMTASSGRKLIIAIYVNNVPIYSFDDVMMVGKDLGRICEIIYVSN